MPRTLHRTSLVSFLLHPFRREGIIACVARHLFPSPSGGGLGRGIGNAHRSLSLSLPLTPSQRERGKHEYAAPDPHTDNACWRRRMARSFGAIVALAALLAAGPALAASGLATSSEASTLAPRLALAAFLVCAGLGLRQVGLVRRHNSLEADLQSLAIFGCACIAFWLVGFDLLRSAGSAMALIPGVIGTVAFWHKAHHARALTVELAAAGIVAMVVAGALAERIRRAPIIIAAIVLGGFLFPIVASWQWGDGWLARLGFVDLGGATLIHSVAGWAALAGAIVLGGRAHRFDPNHQLSDREHHSFGIASFGTAALFIGWQGLIGGLRAAGPLPLSDEGLVQMLLHIDLAAFAGCVAAFALGFWLDRPRAVVVALNGVIAGLVAISADPQSAGIVMSLVIGGIAGIIAGLVPIALERMRIDDVTAAIPAHLCAGIWGTLMAAVSGPGAHIGTQAIGILAVGGFSFAASFILFLVLQILFGLRALPERTANA